MAEKFPPNLPAPPPAGPIARAWRIATSPYLLMVVANLCWAGNWLLGRAMHTDVPPLTLNFGRWTVALAILLPFTGRRLWAVRATVLAEWRIFVALGVLGAALYQSLVYTSLNYTTALNAALLSSVLPMVVVPLTWFLYRDAISLRQGVGMVCSLLGALAILGQGRLETFAAMTFNTGDLFALASVVVWAVYTVLMRRKPAELDAVVALTAIVMVGLTAQAPFFLWERFFGRTMVVGLPSLATMVYMGMFASVVGFLAFNSAVPRLGPNRASLYIHLHPAFTAILAVLLLGEVLRWFHGLGIALIVGGIYLTSVAPTAGRGALPPGTPRQGASPLHPKLGVWAGRFDASAPCGEPTRFTAPSPAPPE
ncbi:MAG: DMT family transporter [bacterium]